MVKVCGSGRLCIVGHFRQVFDILLDPSFVPFDQDGSLLSSVKFPFLHDFYYPASWCINVDAIPIGNLDRFC